MAAFTTVAAAGALASTAITTGMSFAQASKQKQAMEDAQEKASERMAEARKKLDVNYLDALSLPMEAYEQERLAMLNASAQAVQAGAEGESRGAGAVAGRVLDANQKGQAVSRAQMAKDMYNLEASQLEEDSRLRDLDVQLDLQEVEGAQMAAARADENRAMATQQGIQGIGSMVGQAIQFAPLYQKDLGAQRAAIGSIIGNKALGDTAMETVKGGSFDGQTIGLLDYNNMNNQQFKNFKRNLSTKQREGLFYNPAYTDAYQDPFAAYQTFQSNQ
jgi:hypothetical protein